MGLFDKLINAVGGNSQGSDNTSVTDGFDGPDWDTSNKVNLNKRTEIIHEHYDVTEKQANTIAEKLKQELEAEDYSMQLIRSTLETDLHIDDNLLETIVWTEISSIEMIDRVTSYLERDDPNKLYKISGPDPDSERTHPVTEEAIKEVDKEVERKGGVTMEELADILTEKAEKYENEGGTPERMEHWVPHEKCRFSVVAHVDVDL